jgi:hypothetical protein
VVGVVGRERKPCGAGGDQGALIQNWPSRETAGLE